MDEYDDRLTSFLGADSSFYGSDRKKFNRVEWTGLVKLKGRFVGSLSATFH
jgi:hypothetical protein